MGAKQQLGVPKGTRDFSPEEKARRDYIFGVIRTAFQLYGYHALETPAMERLTTLLGKYGEEGDKLLFRVLNSGDFLKGVDVNCIESVSREQLASKLCEKGLRYDLTVPLARYVVEHWHELPRPFKRYQLAPVWRADRPQKGRYREFYQCDIDSVGSDSLLCEVELIQVAHWVFSRLGLETEFYINNRKLLSAMAMALGAKEQVVPLTVAMDKLDKIGVEGVRAELLREGFTEAQCTQVEKLLEVSGAASSQWETLESLFVRDEEAKVVGAQGIQELRTVLNYVEALGLKEYVRWDVSLARGLSYYTGAIFEVKAKGVDMGSICGGGRYDNLTGIFGLSGVSGVGISFGADRIYDCLLELNLFPSSVESTLDVLVVNFSSEGVYDDIELLRLCASLRKMGLRCSYYPDGVKLRRQLDYANRLGARVVVLCGENERKAGIVQLKDMVTGEQRNEVWDEMLVEKISQTVKKMDA